MTDIWNFIAEPETDETCEVAKLEAGEGLVHVKKCISAFPASITTYSRT